MHGPTIRSSVRWHARIGGRGCWKRTADRLGNWPKHRVSRAASSTGCCGSPCWPRTSSRRSWRGGRRRGMVPEELTELRVNDARKHLHGPPLCPQRPRSYAMAITIETFLNPAKFTEELPTKLKEYRLPGIEVDAVVASQRKNVEALAKASRAAFEGTQAVAKRQAEILQETMNQTAKSFDTLAKAGSPPEVAPSKPNSRRKPLRRLSATCANLPRWSRKGAVAKIPSRRVKA